MSGCVKLKNLNCSMNSILQRITPIDFIDNILVINSPLTIDSTILSIDGTIITGSGGVLELPENTTVGNTPLLSPHYVDGVYVLPDKTEIGGTSILNVNYFYFYTAYTYYNNFKNGYFINNYGGYPDTPSANNPGNFPFFAPMDCVLTSLRFSMAVVNGDKDSSNINNVRATIYTISLSGVQTNTLISAVIAGPISVNKRAYAETAFQYNLKKGYSVGIKVEFNGSATSTAGVSVFATLGYKFQ